MRPLIDRLKQEGIEIESLEVWQNEENGQKLAELDKGLCGGVPFFVNTETKAFLCGEADYEDLKGWATGK
ncbi:MAG: hypothetical protein HY220_04085 [Candidatus Sungbacteria bacterium]|uniref:Glutaredoxin domain-containing protein n=1 Tax=Candidatus Sungiibacteriota bacterium TaxID=2750080 RepID=A0A9D6LQQ8_9BACT|nr:hypothetical protein [Candidatus Sungbacteria bacterium]